MTDIWLAKQLRPYGIRPKTIWIGDDHAKGYEPEELEDVFRRYIPMSEVDELRRRVRRAQEPVGEKRQVPGDPA